MGEHASYGQKRQVPRVGLVSVLLATGMVVGLHPSGSIAQEDQPVPEQTSSDEQAKLGVVIAPSSDAGVYVVDVEPGSPAATAGIREGDYVLSIDGETASSPSQLGELIRKKKPGSKVTIATWWRGAETSRDVVLTSTREEPGSSQPAWLGVSFQESRAVGAKIAEVVTGSPAAIAGLRRGDLIIQFDGLKVTSADEMVVAVQALKPDTKAELVVRRGSKQETVKVTLGQRNIHHRGYYRGWVPYDADRDWPDGRRSYRRRYYPYQGWRPRQYYYWRYYYGRPRSYRNWRYYYRPPLPRYDRRYDYRNRCPHVGMGVGPVWSGYWR